MHTGARVHELFMLPAAALSICTHMCFPHWPKAYAQLTQSCNILLCRPPLRRAGLRQTVAIMNEESLPTVIMVTRITSGQEMRLSSETDPDMHYTTRKAQLCDHYCNYKMTFSVNFLLLLNSEAERGQYQ